MNHHQPTIELGGSSWTIPMTNRISLRMLRSYSGYRLDGEDRMLKRRLQYMIQKECKSTQRISTEYIHINTYTCINNFCKYNVCNELNEDTLGHHRILIEKHTVILWCATGFCCRVLYIFCSCFLESPGYVRWRGEVLQPLVIGVV